MADDIQNESPEQPKPIKKRHRSKLDKKIFESICTSDVAYLIGVSKGRVTQLLEYGSPRNADNTYNLPVFLQWLWEWEKSKIKDNTMSKLDQRKREAEIEKIELHNKQQRGELMPVTAIDEIIGARARTAANHFRQSLRENVHVMEMKKREELYPIVDEIAISTMEVYIGDKKGG